VIFLKFKHPIVQARGRESMLSNTAFEYMLNLRQERLGIGVHYPKSLQGIHLEDF